MLTFLQIIFALIVVTAIGFFIYLAFYFFYDLKTGVVTAPTLPLIRKRISEIIQAEIAQRTDKNLVIYDLGSGCGELTLDIARHLPHCRVIGIELSPLPWALSVIRQKLLKQRNLSYHRIDFWSHDCSDASVIVLYLGAKLIHRAQEKLRKEAKAGTLIISNSFPWGDDWPAEAVEDIPLPLKPKLYIYRK